MRGCTTPQAADGCGVSEQLVRMPEATRRVGRSASEQSLRHPKRPLDAAQTADVSRTKADGRRQKRVDGLSSTGRQAAWTILGHEDPFGWEKRNGSVVSVRHCISFTKLYSSSFSLVSSDRLAALRLAHLLVAQALWLPCTPLARSSAYRSSSRRTRRHHTPRRTRGRRTRHRRPALVVAPPRIPYLLGGAAVPVLLCCLLAPLPCGPAAWPAEGPGQLPWASGISWPQPKVSSLTKYPLLHPTPQKAKPASRPWPAFCLRDPWRPFLDPASPAPVPHVSPPWFCNCLCPSRGYCSTRAAPLRSWEGRPDKEMARP